MIVNVIYLSKKGHTEAVAEAIAEQCGVEAIDISTPHVLPESDLLFIGMGIYAGKPDEALLKYLDDLPVGSFKGAAIFSTSCIGKDQTELAVNLLKHKHVEVYSNHLSLPGQFLFLQRKRPNSSDLAAAKRWAQKVLDAFNG